MKKYKLTENYKIINNRKSYQIEAIKDFSNVKKGDLGGWIEKEENLSHEGNCWVYGNARVYGNSKIYDNAIVSGNIRVFDSAKVYDDAIVSDNVRVYGNAIVHNNANVYGNSRVSGNAIVSGCMRLIAGNYNFQYDNPTKQLINYIYCSTGLPIINNDYLIAYKRVNKTEDPEVFVSCYDPDFKYKIGEIAKVKNFDSNIMRSCSTGIHLSNVNYWEEGDTLIACKVNIKDIITCLEGKLRTKKCEVLGVINGLEAI